MKQWKNKLQIRFLWSYVIVLFAALLAIFFVAESYTGHVLESKLLEFSQSQVNETARRLDRIAEEAEAVALKTSLDINMMPHIALRDKVQEMKLLQTLEALMTASNNISNILLHYDGSEEVFTVSGKYTLRYLEDPEQLSFLFEEERTPGIPRPTALDVPELLQEGAETAEAVAITYDLPFSGAGTYGTISCLVPRRVFDEMFAEVPEDAEFAVAVTNMQGEIIYSSEEAALQMLETALESGSTGDEYCMVLADSTATGSTVYLFLERASLFSAVSQLRGILFFIVVVTLLVAAAANIYISRRNYAPILDLREFIDMNQLVEGGDDPMEMFSSVKQIYSENQILSEQLRLRQKIALGNLVSEVVSGGNPQTLGRRLRDLAEQGIYLAAQEYAVLWVKLEDEQMIADKAVLLLEERIAQRGLQNRMFAACREEKDRFLILLLFAGDAEHALPRAVAFVEAALAEDQIRARIAAGSIETRMEDIPISAGRARAMLEEEDGAVLRYPEPEKAGWKYWRTEAKVVQQLIANHTPEKAADYWCAMVDRIAEQYAGREEGFAGAMVLAAEIVEHTAAENEKMEVDSLLDQLMQTRSLGGLRETMRETIFQISEMVRSCKQQAGAALLQQIVAYVDEYFANEQMSLELLSRRFGVSIYYISKYFQEAAGMNFNQYLASRRMEYAKELLRTTDLTLREITAKVGYVDESSFARKFKSMFAITPGQYRRQAGREQRKDT